MALTEGSYSAEFLLSEAPGTRSRQNVTVQSGQNVVAGEVLGADLLGTAAAVAGNTGDGTMGAVTVGPDVQVGEYQVKLTGTGPGVAATGTGAAVAGNTGDGTITAAPATGANAKVGTYMITCIEPAANAGEFQVEDPDGVVLGIATVAVEFTAGTHLTFTIADGAADFVAGDAFTIVVAAANSGTFSVTAPDGTPLAAGTVAVAYASTHVNFTLADGATDFVVNDAFTIVVAQDDFTALTLAATDGGQIAQGVAWDNYDASAADVKGVAIVRDAEVQDGELTWPAGITAAQKTQATTELAALGIVIL